MSIKIYTYAYKRSDFLYMQYKTFKKFMEEDFEYFVFDTTHDNDMAMSKDIMKACQDVGAVYVRVLNRNHNTPNESHAHAINWSYLNYALRDKLDYLLFVDFDVFLIGKFSVSDFMSGYDMAGIPQSRGAKINYLWPGLLFLDMVHLPQKETIDLFCGQVDGVNVDSGGQLSIYMREHPTLNIKRLAQSYMSSKDNMRMFFSDDIADKYDPQFEYEIVSNRFLHYGRGSNWNNKNTAYMDRKTNMLKMIINKLLS